MLRSSKVFIVHIVSQSCKCQWHAGVDIIKRLLWYVNKNAINAQSRTRPNRGKAQNKIHSFHSYFGELEAQGKISYQFKRREEKEIENEGEVTGLRTHVV